jgi:hypothetical protein
MTANIRTSLEQKINKIIPNFSTSNLHTIASTMIFEGKTKSRFSLFYESIGITPEEQNRINGLATKSKKIEYNNLITKNRSYRLGIVADLLDRGLRDQGLISMQLEDKNGSYVKEVFLRLHLYVFFQILVTIRGL